MKNSSTISVVLSTAITAVIVVLSVILLGLTIPTFMSFIIAMTSKFTFSECMGSEGFWVASVICTIIAAIHIGHEYESK